MLFTTMRGARAAVWPVHHERREEARRSRSGGRCSRQFESLLCQIPLSNTSAALTPASADCPGIADKLPRPVINLLLAPT